jgi:hypothetical protein
VDPAPLEKRPRHRRRNNLLGTTVSQNSGPSSTRALKQLRGTCQLRAQTARAKSTRVPTQRCSRGAHLTSVSLQTRFKNGPTTQGQQPPDVRTRLPPDVRTRLSRQGGLGQKFCSDVLQTHQGPEADGHIDTSGPSIYWQQVRCGDASS